MAIAQIALPSFPQPDKLIWYHTSEGTYTVKSGCGIARIKSVGLMDKPEPSFKVIWKLEVPPKGRNFWWNTLATKENLFKRKCSQFPCCMVCDGEVESVEHILTQCLWTIPVWLGRDLHLLVNQENCSSMQIWTSKVIDSSPSLKEAEKVIRESCVSGLVYLEGRNGQVFNQEQVDPNSTFVRAFEAHSEFESISAIQRQVLDHYDDPPLANSA